MLALSFFTVVFSSLLWVIYAIVQVADKLSDGALNNAGIVDISIYVAFVLLPVFALWVIFGIISQYLHNQNFNRNLFYLLSQMKKNQDYSDLLARIMLEGEQQIKDGFAIQQFDLFISDMNELISEIIQRSSLASPEQIDRLWSKVRNGGKWAFGKVIIEVNQNQPSFQMRIFDKAMQDKVLAGTIMEFCARYLGTVDLFEKHDHEKIFLGIIENGVLGKVYSIFSPISDELRRKRNAALKQKPQNTDFAAQAKSSYQPELVIDDEEESQKLSAPVSSVKSGRVNAPKTPKFSLSDTLSFLRRKKESEPQEESAPASEEKDVLSIALERSFGATTPTKEEPSFSVFDIKTSTAVSKPVDEPKFSISLPETDNNSSLISEPDNENVSGPNLEPKPVKTVSRRAPYAEMSSTQRTLDNLRKEWEDLKKAEGSSYESAPTANKANPTAENDDDNLTYPFGGWTNEDNYNK